MAGATTTLWDPLLKENYSDERLADLTNLESIAWNLFTKKTKFYGKRKVVPVKYAKNEGVGPTITIAIAQLGSSLAKDFLVTRKTKLGVARLSRELLAVAKADKYAFLEAADEEIGSTEKNLISQLCSELWRNSGGSIGRLTAASDVTTATVYLRNIDDAVNFSPGQIIQLASTDGTSGSVRTGTITVLSVERVTGALTFTTHVDDCISAAAASYYLFHDGMFGIGAQGVDAWIPATAPTSGDSFCGVDRSVEPTYLAGIRVTASGGTVEDSLILAAIQGAKFGVKFDYCFLNPTLMGTLVRELGSKAQYVKTSSLEAAIGASILSITVPTQKGTIKCVADQYTPNGTAYFLDLSTWAIESADQAPHIQTDDKTGYIAFPVADDDSVEMRMAAYWNLICTNPGRNMRCDGF